MTRAKRGRGVATPGNRAVERLEVEGAPRPGAAATSSWGWCLKGFASMTAAVPDDLGRRRASTRRSEIRTG